MGCYILSEYEIKLPWFVRGNFHVILIDEEKIGGLSIYPQEYEDFEFCVNSCDYVDVKFKGSAFTYRNDKIDNECIFK